MDSSPIYTALVEEFRGRPSGDAAPAAPEPPTIAFEVTEPALPAPAAHGDGSLITE